MEKFRPRNIVEKSAVAWLERFHQIKIKPFYLGNFRHFYSIKFRQVCEIVNFKELS